MKFMLIATVVVGLFVGAGTYGCAQSAMNTRVSASTVSDPVPTAKSADPSQQPLPFSQRHPRYRVMRDDVLVFSFPLTPELNQTVTVQPDGFITLVNAGTIYVQGMTVPEIVDASKTAYSKVLNNPIVDVDVKDFQKPFFVVSGQVGKPGQYDLRYDLTVTQALAVAGGLTADAKGQAFLFRRVSSDWAEVRKLNIGDILNGKNINEDVYLRPGDMIVVPTAFITKFKRYVPYSFGMYLNPGSAL